MKNKKDDLDTYTDIPAFKELILDLHRMYPNGAKIEDRITKVVISIEQRKALLDSKILLCVPSDTGNWYSLGPQGLSLVSTWKNEELTKIVIKLTILTIGATLISLLLNLVDFKSNQLLFAIGTLSIVALIFVFYTQISKNKHLWEY